MCHKMNVIAKFVVGISRPHHPLCMQIIILTIQAKKINNNASGHENENYQKNTEMRASAFKPTVEKNPNNNKNKLTIG